MMPLFKFSPLLRKVFFMFFSGVSLACAALEVRTAAQDSYPKFHKEGKNITGLCVDLFKAIERIDPELKFSEPTDYTPLPRIEMQLENGEIDAFCGFGKTEKRDNNLDFIEKPIYTTYGALGVRMDDNVDIKTFEDIRKLGDAGVVLVISKSIHAEILAAQQGIKVDSSAKNISMNLQKLSAGRGRFAFHTYNVLAEQIKRDHHTGKIRILPVRFDAVDRYMVVSKKAPPRLKEKLAAAIETLRQSGELARIFRVYYADH